MIVKDGEVVLLEELLIHKGAKLDLQDYRGHTALHRAASRGHTEIVRAPHTGRSPHVPSGDRDVDARNNHQKKKTALFLCSFQEQTVS